MSNIGRRITNFFCNGFFGRTYDLVGSEIIAEGDCWIVIKKPDGVVQFANFQTWDWVRDEEQYPIKIKDLRIDNHMQTMIDEWCATVYDIPD